MNSKEQHKFEFCFFYWFTGFSLSQGRWEQQQMPYSNLWWIQKKTNKWNSQSFFSFFICQLELNRWMNRWNMHLFLVLSKTVAHIAKNSFPCTLSEQVFNTKFSSRNFGQGLIMGKYQLHTSPIIRQRVIKNLDGR